MNTKQRAQLRSFANGIEAIVQVGKMGVTDQVIRQTDEALTARELVKCKTLETCALSVREACDAVCEAAGAEPVQIIGRVFVIYRQNKELNQYGI